MGSSGSWAHRRQTLFIVGDSGLLGLCSWELMTGGALSVVMEAHDGWDSVCSGGLMSWLITALWIKK